MLAMISPAPSNLVLALVLSIALYIYRRVTRKSDVQSLPCPPKASWLWGHELEEFKRPTGDLYNECIEKYGPTFRIKGAFGQKDILVLTDPTGIAYVSRNVYKYPHSTYFRPLIERLVGRGLIWVEGEKEHRRMRRLINPAFTAESVKAMSPVIHEAAGKLQARITNDLFNNNGAITVNIIEYSSGAALDVIGKVAFDHDFGQGLDLEAKRIAMSWEAQVLSALERSGFAAMLILRTFPFLISLPFKRIQAQGDLKSTIKRIGTEMVERENVETIRGNNLLSVLMRASLKEKEPISKDELMDHITTIVMAGHETTSLAISFTLWELAKNPEKQKILREEALAFPGNPTYDDFQTKLPYLDACCKEGLRLHPPSALMERFPESPDVIPLHYPVKMKDGKMCSSLHVEKDQLIYIPILSVNRLSLIWGDGETFRPERWLEPSKETSKVKIEGWSNILSFADGPRNCVGYRLAVLEFKVLMFTYIRHFVFHDTGAQLFTRHFGTMQPRVIGRESEGIRLPLKVTLA